MSEGLRKKRILILAEGYEEKPYIDKMLSFPNINRDAYEFLETINVKGNGQIVPRYQFEIQRDSADIVLVFCDADKGSEQFWQIVFDIGNNFFSRPEDGIHVFIFANPVTLQIVLSHFGEVSLTKVGKKKNAEVVEKLTGVSNYDAGQEQIAEIVSQIHFRSLDDFKARLSKLSTNPECVPSTNFLEFLCRFEGEDTAWIQEINDLRKC